MFKKRYANLLVYINSFDRIKEQDKVITELKSNMDVVISESFIEQQKLLDKINKMEADKQIVFKLEIWSVARKFQINQLWKIQIGNGFF